MVVEKIAHWVSGYNRKRKFEFLLKWIVSHNPRNILDVGYSSVEYSPNDNYLEKHMQDSWSVTALGIDDPAEFRQRYPKVNVVQYDGRLFPFESLSFDLGWSNAVIEHVGSREDQIFFLKEFSRTCRAVIFTTPNKKFPVEVHTRIPLLHYLPKPVFDSFLRLIGKSWATGSYMRLLGKADIKKMLHEAGITEFTIFHNRLFFFTLDFLVIFYSSGSEAANPEKKAPSKSMVVTS